MPADPTPALGSVRWEPWVGSETLLLVVSDAVHGHIAPRDEAKPDGDWSAFVPALNGGLIRLRSYDDRLAAARALCARVGVEMPELPEVSDAT